MTFTRASYDKFENESKGFWDKVVAASGGKVRIFSGANGQKAPIAKVQRRRSPRTQALKNCDGDDCSESEEKTEILIALQSDIKVCVMGFQILIFGLLTWRALLR